MSDFILWVTWFAKFIYNLLYTVKVPGLDIPLIYLLIFATLMVMILSFVKRVLYQPIRSSDK